MATTMLGAVLLVFVTQLQIGVTQPLDIKSDAERYNLEIYIRNLKFDLEHQINGLKEEFSETITKLETMIKCKRECSKGWKRYGQSCYMINKQSLSWSDAVESCRNLSAYLAEIDTKGENDFIQKMLKENNYFDQVWLGGTDKTNETTWIWIFSGSPLRFKNWMKGEPNDQSGREDCMEMYVKDGGWNDNGCSSSFLSVCEKDL
ncbi:perlucin-like protein [Ostrea edulis]|uniref:perlucin-like protein n=1 Tax=Ostrea edulis TaxID=37623 RepID=UPI0024AEB5BB|nr:perlucin-like protein [Ostrea edulis]XP_056002932.1 perlucin-like protein [Ostrea edulis]